MADKMKKLNLKKFLKGNALTYLMVIAAYLVLFALQTLGLLSNSLSGFLVPICAYIVMAVSLNLTGNWTAGPGSAGRTGPSKRQ